MEIDNTNAQNMENKINEFEPEIKKLISFFDNPDKPGLIETPKRYLKALKELLIYPELEIKVFDANGYDEMIVDKNITFYSLCEHHILPFFGTVKIGYVPDKKIIGLSKLSRIVEYYSKRLNTQEYLTDNICNYLDEKLKPLGVGVVVNARHLCKEMRGVKKPGEMITCSLKGIFKDKLTTKNEFLNY